MKQPPLQPPLQLPPTRSAAARRRTLRLGAPLLLAATLARSSTAGLPEPDAVLWGTLTLDGTPITAQRTDVLLLARDPESNTTLASYRMGASPAAGDHFVLRIPLQSDLPPPPLPTSARLGSQIEIQVAAALQPLGQQPVSLTARGLFQRLDLNLGQSPDTNGLPDDWERAFFGTTGQNPDADPDADGRTNRQEFEAGTHPNQADDAPALSITWLNQSPTIQFLAHAATGTGYQGFQRRFTLESAPALTPDLPNPWSPVPEFDDLPASNQPVLFSPTLTSAPRFFRLRLRLVRTP